MQKVALVARRRGWRVNLRPIAEWRTLLFLASSWMLLRWMLWPLLRLIYLVHASKSAITPADRRLAAEACTLYAGTVLYA